MYSGRHSTAKATGLIWPRTVTGDGEGLVSHAGLVGGETVRQRALQQRLLDRLQGSVRHLGTPTGGPTSAQTPWPRRLASGYATGWRSARDVTLSEIVNKKDRRGGSRPPSERMAPGSRPDDGRLLILCI